MNILLLMMSKGTGLGGMEKHVQELANGLCAKGHSVTCASSVNHQSLLADDVKKITLNTKRSRYSPNLLIRLLKITRNGQFDVVHAHGSKAAAVLQLLAPFLSRTKLIATIHNFKSTYPKPHAFTRIIAVSKKLAMDVGYSNVTVVYNGIAPKSSLNSPTVLLPESTRPIWLAVGRLVPAKGFDFLINAFRHASGTLFIAGAGPDHAKLSEQILSTSQAGKIKLLGHRDDIPALMEQADGVVISSYREGFSYVFAEALLAGKPVIATDVPIANEFLESQFIHSDFDPKTFGKMLNTEIKKLTYNQLNARERAQNLLSLDKMVEETINVYQQCLQRSD